MCTMMPRVSSQSFELEGACALRIAGALKAASSFLFSHLLLLLQDSRRLLETTLETGASIREIRRWVPISRGAVYASRVEDRVKTFAVTQTPGQTASSIALEHCAAPATLGRMRTLTRRRCGLSRPH